jgi:hypothetical protein
VRSPLPVPDPAGPSAASSGACDAHSLIVTPRTWVTEASPAAVPGRPNTAMFSFDASASKVSPSMLTTRHRPKNAPAVSSSATGRATRENSSSNGREPSRFRALVSPPERGSKPSPQSASTPAIRSATSS